MDMNEGREGRSTWRERERLRARKLILETAAELFARDGYDGTGMKQIADHIGISVGKLYTHFEGKEDILRELIENYTGELREKGEKARDQSLPPLEQLRNWFRAAIDHYRKHRNLVMIFLNENPLRLEGMIKDEMKRKREIVAGLFSEAVERGDIADENPYMLAAVVTGAAHRLIYTLTELGDEDGIDDVPGILDRIILKPLELRRGRHNETEDNR